MFINTPNINCEILHFNWQRVNWCSFTDLLTKIGGFSTKDCGSFVYCFLYLFFTHFVNISLHLILMQGYASMLIYNFIFRLYLFIYFVFKSLGALYCYPYFKSLGAHYYIYYHFNFLFISRLRATCLVGHVEGTVSVCQRSHACLRR